MNGIAQNGVDLVKNPQMGVYFIRLAIHGNHNKF